jgi:hypothetical protein
MVWRRITLAAVICAALPAPAGGQDVWGSLPVPGGGDAARRSLALQASAERPDALLLLDFADRYAALRNRPIHDVANRYFRYFGALEAAMAAEPDGCGLPASSVPGERERSRTCLAGLGLRLTERGGVFAADLDGSGRAAEMRDWLAAAGVDAGALVEAINGGGRARVDLEASVVPLPLPGFWTDADVAGDGPLIAAITRRENLVLLYRGLFSLDDDTLAYLSANPVLVRRLSNDTSRAFAVFGRSIHIRDGVVRVPGGADMAPVWQRLAGRSAGTPDDFVRALLTEDDGRLAFFYDAVSRLDPVRQAAALGDGLSGDARRDHVERVYRSFRTFDEYWTAADQPFQLRAFDPAMALALVAFGRDGLVGPDWWPSLLERVSESDAWPGRPDDTLRRLRSTRADAVWLLEWLFDRPDAARHRFGLLRYLQRQFPDAPREAAPSLELALRTWSDRAALALALERMGVQDPELVGELGRRTHELSRAGTSERAARLVARWQCAFGWLEQLHRHRPMPPAVLAGLLRSLAAAAPGRVGDGDGLIPSWVVEELVPALGGNERRTEREMFEAALAPAAASQSADRVVWEGLEYRVTPHRPILRTIEDIRAAQPGPRLDDLVALHAVRRALEAGPASVEAVAAIAAALDLQRPAARRLVERRVVEDRVISDLEHVVGNLSRIDRPRDLGRATRDLPRLVRVIDAFADVILPQTLYALAAAPTTRPAALYADGWSSHAVDARLSNDRRPWSRLVWDAPMSSPEARGDASIHGSFVSLDVALADARLRDVASDELLAPPTIAAPDRLAMLQSLALSRPGAGDVSGPPRVDTVARGRVRVEEWSRTLPARPELRAALMAAGLDSARVNLALWTAEREPGALATWLTVTELYWLGGGSELPDAWGVAGREIDGCLCFERLESWTGRWLRDRAGSGLAGAALSDLSLRLAEHLEALQLPPSLVPLLFGGAMRDWIDRAWPLVPSDAVALYEFPSRLTLGRVEDYLLALIADGTLTVTGAGEAAWVR